MLLGLSTDGSLTKLSGLAASQGITGSITRPEVVMVRLGDWDRWHSCYSDCARGSWKVPHLVAAVPWKLLATLVLLCRLAIRPTLEDVIRLQCSANQMLLELSSAPCCLVRHSISEIWICDTWMCVWYHHVLQVIWWYICGDVICILYTIILGVVSTRLKWVVGWLHFDSFDFSIAFHSLSFCTYFSLPCETALNISLRGFTVIFSQVHSPQDGPWFCRNPAPAQWFCQEPLWMQLICLPPSNLERIFQQG